jgi:hypothetical protein
VYLAERSGVVIEGLTDAVTAKTFRDFYMIGRLITVAIGVGPLHPTLCQMISVHILTL